MSSAASPLPGALARCVNPAVDLERAFDACADSLYRYFAVRCGRDGHLADDLMQQLWVHAHNLPATPPDQLEFRLRAIAKNLLRTHWRRHGSRPAPVPLADPALAADLAESLVTAELPEDVLVRQEVQDQLLLALTELPSAQQALIVGHYFENRSLAELGERSGLSPRAVEGRLYRARLALREKLQNLEPF